MKINTTHQPVTLIKVLPAVVVFTLIFAFNAIAADKITVRVGAYNNPPKMMVSEAGKVSGFWAELTSYLASLEDWDVQYIKGNWADALENLSTGKIDMMPDVAFTKKRASLYDFASSPVMASWSRIYIRRSDNSIKSLEDLRNKKIAVLSGSVNVEGPDGIKKLVQSFNLNCQVVEMESYGAVFSSLEDEYADAVIANKSFGDEYIKHHPVKKTPIMLSPVTLTYAFPKESEFAAKIKSRVDYHIFEMMNDDNSYYYKLLTKYFEPNVAEKKVVVFPAWLKAILISVLATVVVLGSAVIMVRRQVRLKTKELVDLNSALQDMVNAETAKRLNQEKLIFEQKKHADMGQMIKSIAHQWRQPLNNIYLLSQDIQDSWSDGRPYDNDMEKTFSMQYDLVQHMSHTIDDFLNFFRPDNAKTTFNAAEALITCMRLVSAETKSKKIETSLLCITEEKRCEMTEDFGPQECRCTGTTVYGFQGEFKQIIMNLLANSIYAVKTYNNNEKRISAEIDTRGDNITITISDTGGGISEDKLDRIFDPYFTTKPEGQGIGMGLYMSRVILQNHMEGNIRIRNIQGGIEVQVTLPKAG